MDREKNIILMVNQNLMVFILMIENGKEKFMNIIKMVNYYLKEIIYMEVKMEMGQNMMRKEKLNLQGYIYMIKN